LAAQFAKGGTETLENRRVFETPEVRKAGGLAALKTLGEPSSVLSNTKARLFTA
jgi:type I restriction enzyme R subunit